MEDYGSLGLCVDSAVPDTGVNVAVSTGGPRNCSGHGSTIRLIKPINVVERQIKLHPGKYVRVRNGSFLQKVWPASCGVENRPVLLL